MVIQYHKCCHTAVCNIAETHSLCLFDKLVSFLTKFVMHVLM